MTTKTTFAVTLFLASIVMVTISGTAQSAYAQIFQPDLADGQTAHVVLLEDESGSVSIVDPQSLDPENEPLGDGCPDDNAIPPPSITTCSEWELQKRGEQAGLQALYDQFEGTSADLFGRILWTVIGFGTTASQQCQFQVDTQTDLDDLKACIQNKQKINGFTCMTCAFNLARDALLAAPKDEHIIDIITDGKPEDVNIDTKPLAKAAAADAVAMANVKRIVALAIGVEQVDFEFLRDDIVHPQPGQEQVDAIRGFALKVDDFEQFRDAFEEKLGGEINPCETDPTLPQCKVGGEFLPIDSSALVIAGMSANMGFIVPIAAGIVGVGAYFIRSRMR